MVDWARRFLGVWTSLFPKRHCLWQQAYRRKKPPIHYPPYRLCAALTACAFWHMIDFWKLLHTHTHAHTGYTVLTEQPNLVWLTRSHSSWCCSAWRATRPSWSKDLPTTNVGGIGELVLCSIILQKVKKGQWTRSGWGMQFCEVV